MQFSLKTLLILFVVLATSLAAFWIWGIFVSILCLLIGLLWHSHRWKSLRNILIVFFCVAIFIPPVIPLKAYTRELALRTGCTNNLKNLVRAMQNYHSVNGCFPISSVFGKANIAAYSWRIQIMPYAEREDVYKMGSLAEFVGKNWWLAMLTCVFLGMAGQMNEEKTKGRKRPRQWKPPGPAGHSPALVWVSLVGLLASRARLRFARQKQYIAMQEQ